MMKIIKHDSCVAFGGPSCYGCPVRTMSWEQCALHVHAMTMIEAWNYYRFQYCLTGACDWAWERPSRHHSPRLTGKNDRDWAWWRWRAMTMVITQILYGFHFIGCHFIGKHKCFCSRISNRDAQRAIIHNKKKLRVVCPLSWLFHLLVLMMGVLRCEWAFCRFHTIVGAS